MHPQIVRDAPGFCPICGMALEPRTAGAEEQPNEALSEMQRRFVVSAILTAPVVVVGVLSVAQAVLPAVFQLLLATPVVVWGGWPFFERGWSSVVTRNLSMFTLIAMG